MCSLAHDPILELALKASKSEGAQGRAASPFHMMGQPQEGALQPEDMSFPPECCAEAALHVLAACSSMMPPGSTANSKFPMKRKNGWKEELLHPGHAARAGCRQQCSDPRCCTQAAVRAVCAGSTTLSPRSTRSSNMGLDLRVWEVDYKSMVRALVKQFSHT